MIGCFYLSFIVLGNVCAGHYDRKIVKDSKVIGNISISVSKTFFPYSLGGVIEWEQDGSYSIFNVTDEKLKFLEGEFKVKYNGYGLVNSEISGNGRKYEWILFEKSVPFELCYGDDLVKRFKLVK